MLLNNQFVFIAYSCRSTISTTIELYLIQLIQCFVFIRRCSTGEGIFSFRTSNGHEVMRQLKRAITNWAQYKANCRSNSRQSCLNTCSSSQRSRYSRSRSSAPCTPNMSSQFMAGTALSSRATTPSPRKTMRIRRGPSDGESTSMARLSKDKSCSISDDVNYVIPIFDDEAEEDEEKSSSCIDYTNSRPKVFDKCRQRVSRNNSRRNSCHTSSDSSRTNSNSDDNNGTNDDRGVDANAYLELIPT